MKFQRLHYNVILKSTNGMYPIFFSDFQTSQPTGPAAIADFRKSSTAGTTSTLQLPDGTVGQAVRSEAAGGRLSLFNSNFRISYIESLLLTSAAIW